MKKVILLLVDSFMPTIFEDGLRHRTLPALRFLEEKGRYWPNCVTVFPTMTASVDSSLLTGVYPHQHRVPGLIWYNPDEKEIINYINGWPCVWKLGLTRCAENILYHLNEKHLSKNVSTLFEELALRGKTSASINTILHRGVREHQLNLPFLLRLITRFRFRKPISGPDILTLGSMVQTNLNMNIPADIQGFRQMYGINDTYAVQVAKHLITSKQQPDFMLVYLPDNDRELHRKSPANGEASLIRVDRQIQEVLNSFSSWEQAIEQSVFIVTSDHGQTHIGSAEHFNIDLDNLLRPFVVLQLGEVVQNHELVVCNNERMAYIYPLKKSLQEQVLIELVAESRIDLVAWKKEGGVLVREGGAGRELFYQPQGTVADIYGIKWSVQGEYSILDLRLENGLITYGDYPDVLARLYGALYSQDIPVIVITARPRYAFKSKYHPTHLNGGSHGSLHKYDSMIPLIVAGAGHPLSNFPRLIDLKNYILALLDEK